MQTTKKVLGILSLMLVSASLCTMEQERSLWREQEAQETARIEKQEREWQQWQKQQEKERKKIERHQWTLSIEFTYDTPLEAQAVPPTIKLYDLSAKSFEVLWEYSKHDLWFDKKYILEISLNNGERRFFSLQNNKSLIMRTTKDCIITIHIEGQIIQEPIMANCPKVLIQEINRDSLPTWIYPSGQIVLQ